jgi:hypothetical protein
MKHIVFPFNHNTSGLRSGQAAAYTPNAGEQVYDAWLEISEAWDAITPSIDLGLFLSGRVGLHAAFGITFGASNDLSTYALDGDGGGLGVLIAGSGTTKTMRVASGGLGPVRFLSSDPLCVCVSQDGTPSGDDPGCTTGAAELHLLILEAGE